MKQHRCQQSLVVQPGQVSLRWHRIWLNVALLGCCSSTVAIAADRGLYAMANPAAVACQEAGGKLTKIYTDKGEQGMCTLPSGVVCEEWAFFKGTCGLEQPAQSKSSTEGVKPASSK